MSPLHPADGAFSVAYPDKATLKPDGWPWNVNDGDLVGNMVLFGEPAGNQRPRQIAGGLIKQTYPDATIAYEVSNAMVAHQPGYGEIGDFYPQSLFGGFTRNRVLVEVAEKTGSPSSPPRRVPTTSSSQHRRVVPTNLPAPTSKSRS